MTTRQKISFMSLVVALTPVSAAWGQSDEEREQPSLPGESVLLPQRTALQRLTSADADIDQWNRAPALAARRVMDRYGAPDEIRPAYLAWDGVGPWARIVVFNNDILSMEGKDLPLIQQSVTYAPNPAQTDALAAFDPRVQFDPRSGLLSALSETEELNNLRMNLADDVVALRKTPRDARADFDRTVLLSVSGKISASMRALHFPFGRFAN